MAEPYKSKFGGVAVEEQPYQSKFGGVSADQPEPESQKPIGQQPLSFGGLARTMADQAVEGGKGMLKTAGRDLYDTAMLPARLLGMQTPLDETVYAATEPSANSPAQTTGQYLTRAAELYAPGRALLKAGASLLPSAERAGRNFDLAMKAAKDVPVDVSKFAPDALRAMKMNKVAGTPVAPAVRKAAGYLNPTTKPLTYGDARILASEAGHKAQKAAIAPGRLTGEMSKRLTGVARGVDEATSEAAHQAGVGGIHDSAMREYANAMRLQAAKQTAKKLAIGAALTGGVYEGGKHLIRKLGE